VLAIKHWLDASDLFGDRSHPPDFDETRILTGVCEVLTSLVYSPGQSQTQRPEPPTLSQMSPGQSDVISLIRELGIDVKLVKFCSTVPVVAPRIGGQTFLSLEMGLRGASTCFGPSCVWARLVRARSLTHPAVHCSIARLLSLSMDAGRPDEMLPMLKAGLLPALSNCGAVLVSRHLLRDLTASSHLRRPVFTVQHAEGDSQWVDDAVRAAVLTPLIGQRARPGRPRPRLHGGSAGVCEQRPSAGNLRSVSVERAGD